MPGYIKRNLGGRILRRSLLKYVLKVDEVIAVHVVFQGNREFGPVLKVSDFEY